MPTSVKRINSHGNTFSFRITFLPFFTFKNNTASEKCPAQLIAPRRRPRKLRKARHWHGERTRLMTSSVEDFGKAKHLVHSAAKSGAYLYPIKVSLLSLVLMTAELTVISRESTTSSATNPYGSPSSPSLPRP